MTGERRSARGRVGAALLVALAIALPSAPPAGAVIPIAPKIADAIAEANSTSGRADPLLMDVSVAIGVGETEVLVEGVLASHPTGLARLEILDETGAVERHLLQGNAYTASRDGELIDQPQPLLPPVFLLQLTSGAALGAALASFGVAEQEVVLGKLDEHDCYVFGGRLYGAGGEAHPLLPSLWVDVESYDPIRIVRTDGVEYRLGPIIEYDGIRIPHWIEIAAPGQLPVRLEILRATQANAPAAAFGVEWLTSPLPEPAEAPLTP